MAQRFYFDITNGSVTIRDEKGVDAKDIHHAAVEAQVALEEMRDNMEPSSTREGWQMTIRGEAGLTLKTLPIL